MSLHVEESKRASGRTTRMILKAAEYLIKYPNKRVVIVGHDYHSTHWLKQYVEGILNVQLAERISYKTMQQTLTHNIREPNYFFDHHCFYAKRQQLMSSLEWVNREYSKYDE